VIPHGSKEEGEEVDEEGQEVIPYLSHPYIKQ
jgi:hypothetical protein